MAVLYPRFITGQSAFKGLAGYLQHMIVGFGTATVVSGQTHIDVVVTQIKAADFVFACLVTKGANACVVNSTTIVAGTGFAITVDTDPGTGGAVFNYLILRSPLV
jgi:hypothetical protein